MRRLESKKNGTFARLSDKWAKWIVKLLDHKLCRLDGKVIFPPAKLRTGPHSRTCPLGFHDAHSRTSGDTVHLYINAYCLASAFRQPDLASDSQDPTSKKQKPLFNDQETSTERALRERQRGINGLFDATGLVPATPSSVFRAQKAKGKMSSAHAMLEGTDWKVKPKPPKLRVEGDGEEEGEELSEGQLDLVYQKAVQHDADLPQMDPPKTFRLSLRPYQKQGLGWMARMEQGEVDAREETSMHPLWEECVSSCRTRPSVPMQLLQVHLPTRRRQAVGRQTKLLCVVPRARIGWSTGRLIQHDRDAQTTTRTRASSASTSREHRTSAAVACSPTRWDSVRNPRSPSGSGLADGRTVGKTIQMAALIVTNRPAIKKVPDVKDEQAEDEDALSSSSDSESDDGAWSQASDEPFVPSPTRATQKNIHQSRLAFGGTSTSAIRKPNMAKSKPKATLVVCPMTLLAQWRDELKRCDKGLRVHVYYGTNRTDLEDELEDGADVVVTRCVDSWPREHG